MTTENIISFTEAAASKITEVLEEQGNDESYLRITLTMGENGGAGYWNWQDKVWNFKRYYA